MGGYLEALRVHDACRALDVPVWCGGMLETGVGRAANVALAALPGFTLPGDTSASGRYFAEDLTEPFVLGEGERLRDLLEARPDVHAVELEEALAPLAPDAPSPPGPLSLAVGEGEQSGVDEPSSRPGIGTDVESIAPSSAHGRGGGAVRGMATVRFVLDGDEHALRTLLAELVGAGLPIYGFGQDASRLEDVFLRLTGHSIRA